MSLKFLITTDNHVGFEENDPIRGEDAARTFNEIMVTAQEQEVDFVIQGGDLFHYNKPSKKALYDVIRILRTTCLGDKPVEFEVLNQYSDPAEGDLNHVNFYDPNLNIAIPVFAIIGNHDDTGGAANLSPLDVLSATGLINQLGKISNNDDVTVTPLLIQKGHVRLALYGLPNIRDERLFQTFRQGKVKFLRPQQDVDSWFNILVIHQNRAAHNEGSYIPENFLPSFLHLVIWGHEHECRIDPVRNPKTQFLVSQPGSSVATTLCEAEAVPKNIAVVTLKPNLKFDFTTIPLKSVRPFVYKTLVLGSDSDLKPARDSREAVTKWLIGEVDQMIREANAAWEGQENVRPLPLIRLRVEYLTGFDIENPARFSRRFSGRIANSSDALQLVKQRKTRLGGNSSKRSADPADTPSSGPPEMSDKEKIEVLITKSMSLLDAEALPNKGFAEAIFMFIDKQEKSSVKNYIDSCIKEHVDNVIRVAANNIIEQNLQNDGTEPIDLEASRIIHTQTQIPETSLNDCPEEKLTKSLKNRKATVSSQNVSYDPFPPTQRKTDMECDSDDGFD